MNFDKDALIKNRFWVLLAGVVPLVIIAIIILVTVVTASIAADKKALEDARKDAEGPFPEPKNPKFVEVMKQAADALQARQDEVWKQVYLPQKHITEGYKAWPKSFNDIFRYHDGRFAKRVQVYTKQPLPPPPEGKAYFQGKATVVDRDYIMVQGTGSEFKSPQEVRFNRSADVKVAIADENNAPKNFFEIPPQSNVVVFYQQAKYFNDPLTDTEREHYARNYRESIPLIVEQVEPVNEKGEGVVQFKSWIPKPGETPPPGSPFLPVVAHKTWLDELKNDFSADAWIAQEDLWITSEIYRLVRLSNDYVSRFIHVGGDGVQSPYVCYNPYWKLEMQIKNDQLVVKATNNTTRRQSLDVFFWINFNNKNVADETKNLSAGEWAEYRARNFEKVMLGGEPVNPSTFSDNYREVKVNLTPGLPRSQIFSVEQVLNWKTAAVKRIDVVEIGAHSQRTVVQGLKPLKTEAAAQVAMDPANPVPIGILPQQQQPRVNVFGLRSERYSEVTPQARRVPVAVSLIVDQQHTNRVLAAFANSDLRLVMTQILQNNYGSVRPEIIEAKGPGVGIQPPFGQPFQPFQPTQPVSEEQEANVELIIYGIISIYERHPPREPEPAAAPVAMP